jgi:hypothetical protein
MSDDPEGPDDNAGEVFRISVTARALPDRRRAEVRLRLLLKDLLRGYGLRCVKVEALDAPGPEKETR